MFEVRTDLAVEENERVQKQNASTHGISVHEEEYEGGSIRITTVRIETENAVRIMGKAKGTYITLEAPELAEETDGYHQNVSEKLAELLCRLIPEGKNGRSILVAGLGNRSVTPDALGPRVADQLCITRHILNEYGSLAYGNAGVQSLSAIVPGVMAQTGMETREILAGVVRQVKPEYLIVIDALAARSLKRLCRTIQISDTGISPGSGVGNHRHSITEQTLGILVIAVGIPTVVEASTIIHDFMSECMSELSERDCLSHLLSPQLNQMFVTTKDIDAQIRQLSYTVSEGINRAFCGD
ncbi:MAG: GPR endopeptidase [Clostridiales bacterium]|nr:GPR endopeptidase [Clostridiales bacterium]